FGQIFVNESDSGLSFSGELPKRPVTAMNDRRRTKGSLSEPSFCSHSSHHWEYVMKAFSFSLVALIVAGCSTVAPTPPQAASAALSAKVSLYPQTEVNEAASA